MQLCGFTVAQRLHRTLTVLFSVFLLFFSFVFGIFCFTFDVFSVLFVFVSFTVAPLVTIWQYNDILEKYIYKRTRVNACARAGEGSGK